MAISHKFLLYISFRNSFCYESKFLKIIWVHFFFQRRISKPRIFLRMRKGHKNRFVFIHIFNYQVYDLFKHLFILFFSGYHYSPFPYVCIDFMLNSDPQRKKFLFLLKKKDWCTIKVELCLSAFRKAYSKRRQWWLASILFCFMLLVTCLALIFSHRGKEKNFTSFSEHFWSRIKHVATKPWGRYECFLHCYRGDILSV